MIVPSVPMETKSLVLSCVIIKKTKQTKKHLHTDVYNSFTHSYQNLEATKVSFRR